MIWGYHHLRKPPYKSEFVLLILFFSSSRGFHRFCTPQSNRFLHPVYLGGDKFWYIAGGEGEEAFITRKDWNAETVNIQSLAILDDWFDGKPKNTAQPTKVWSLVMFLKKTGLVFEYFLWDVVSLFCWDPCDLSNPMVGVYCRSSLTSYKRVGQPRHVFSLHHLDGLLLIFDDCWFFDSPGWMCW